MITTKTTTNEQHLILEDYKVNVEVRQNPYLFDLSDLYQMAARINKKRSFLFVSKLLGKHLAVDPKVCLLTGHLLALRYMEVVHGQLSPYTDAVVDAIQTGNGLTEALTIIEQNPLSLPKPVTCIGFAETATALGQAVFSTFKEHAYYIHTTREQLEQVPSIIDFEEEHSHATSHRVYALQQDFFQDESEVLLIDDEITTGKTAVNIIRSLKETFPHKNTFTVLSILDWRSPEHRATYKQLERDLGITIHSVSLLAGIIDVIGTPNLKEEQRPLPKVLDPPITAISVHDLIGQDLFVYESSVNRDGSRTTAPYLRGTGRFGLTLEEARSYRSRYEKIGETLQTLRKGNRTLVIGTGEFMYLPMKIASFMGEGIFYQSTTRSPIYKTNRTDYLIQQKLTFDSPENPGIINYLYNLETNLYDDLFLFIERMTSPDDVRSLLDALKQTTLPNIKVITMTDFDWGESFDSQNIRST